ncbi:hypothetical protein KTN05_16255 [Paracoccus sp. Z118]|uniref:hypothetical protein n=1 Tax=Paracoccus sp. Z118 TaxID=2851017 RepID=UPI001C2BDAD2|nr:hypothetical protein [Paracoccus sp. Z118]MBV0893364.1 hypothetical protein [Paracoccus sp. Z118]
MFCLAGKVAFVALGHAGEGLNLTDAEGSGAHAPFVGAGIGDEIAGRSEALDLGADKGRKFIIGRGSGDCAAKCRDQLVMYETDPIARIVPGYVIEGEALRVVRGGKLAGRQRIAPRLDGARPA